MTDTAEKVTTLPRNLRLTPQNVRPNNQAAQCWNSWFVIWPPQATKQDIGDHPEMLVGFNIRENDDVRIVSYDRAWCVEATVMRSSPGRVSLGKIRTLWDGNDVRVGIEYETEDYEAEWDGSAYAIYRKAKGKSPRTIISTGWRHISQARAEITKLYPRDAG